jgi:Zn-dependent peptidase ImmA (M78 family)
MKRIIEKAKEILRKWDSDELELLASQFGIEIYEILEGEKIEEVYFPELKAIALRPGLDPIKKNYLIAHALGHHLFHHQGPDRDYLLLHDRDLYGELGRSERARKENEADLFASYLLIPEEKLEKLLEEEWVKECPYDPTPQLAEEFQVPEELMRKRLEFERKIKFEKALFESQG